MFSVWSDSVRKLVRRTSLLGPTFFDKKPTRLTHLLSFASLFDDNVQELYDLSNTLATPMQSQCNLFSLDVFKDELPEVPTRTWSRSEIMCYTVCLICAFDCVAQEMVH